MDSNRRTKILAHVECLIGSPDEKAYKRFGDHAHKIGLETTSVFVVGVDENPVNPSSEIRARGLDRIKWGIDRAHDMSAKVMCGPLAASSTKCVL